MKHEGLSARAGETGNGGYERAGPPSGGPVRSIRKYIILPCSCPTDLHYGKNGYVQSTSSQPSHKSRNLNIYAFIANFCSYFLSFSCCCSCLMASFCMFSSEETVFVSSFCCMVGFSTCFDRYRGFYTTITRVAKIP